MSERVKIAIGCLHCDGKGTTRKKSESTITFSVGLQLSFCEHEIDFNYCVRAQTWTLLVLIRFGKRFIWNGSAEKNALRMYGTRLQRSLTFYCLLRALFPFPSVCLWPISTEYSHTEEYALRIYVSHFSGVKINTSRQTRKILLKFHGWNGWVEKKKKDLDEEESQTTDIRNVVCLPSAHSIIRSTDMCPRVVPVCV